MSVTYITGLVTPFGCFSELAFFEGRTARFQVGAFSSVLRGSNSELWIDHKRPASGALALEGDGTMELWQTSAGLCMRACIHHEDWSAILGDGARRGLLRGLSVGFSHCERRRVVTSLEEISICVQSQPAFGGTWCAIDDGAARARIVDEDAAARLPTM